MTFFKPEIMQLLITVGIAVINFVWGLISCIKNKPVQG